MKKIILILAIFLLVAACEESVNKNKLFEIYKEILFKRESILDTAKANQAVENVLKSHGYNEKQFRREILILAKSEENFLREIDSLRSFVKNEQKRITDSLKNKK